MKYSALKKKGVLALLGWAGLILFALPNLVQSAHGKVITSGDEDSDRPAWAGSQGKDGKPGRGNDDSGSGHGDLYGDLYIIVRDSNGEPQEFVWTWDGDQYVPQLAASGKGCLQPIAINAPEDYPEEFKFEGIEGSLKLIPLNADCEIQQVIEGYDELLFDEYTQEVEFGRLSISRAPGDVLDSAYNEALSTINNGYRLGTDPAGRIVVFENEADEVGKTIDSPLENLALYKELMVNGHLSSLASTVELGELDHLRGEGIEDVSFSDLNTAAALLAGAADKFGAIGLDLVVNLNTFLGINSTTGYFNFITYRYDRDLSYSNSDVMLILPVCEELEGGAIITGLVPRRVTLLGAVPKTFHTGQVAWEDARGFVQAADDALRIIYYIHNWSVPELPVGFEWEQPLEIDNCSSE